MEIAGIVLDDWKLEIFKKILDKEGYKYTKHEGPVAGSFILKVETNDIPKLHSIVKIMNREAAKSKDN